MEEEQVTQFHYPISISMERRQQILSKDLITIKEFGELLGIPYQTAAKIMRDIKRKTDRVVMAGYLHIQDYLDFYKLPPERYLVIQNTRLGGNTPNENSRAN